MQASELDLATLLRAAEDLNPAIAAAHEEFGAAGGRSLQAGLLPNPTLRLEVEELPENDFALERSKHTLGFRQPLILGGRLGAEKNAAEADEHVRLLRLEVVRRAVFADVRAAYAEALALRASVLTHEELLAIAQRTFDVARTRFDARAVPESEVIRAELEVHELQLGARTLSREADALIARLRALLGGVELRMEQFARAPDPTLRSFDDARFTRNALDENPELLAARAEVDTADRRLDAAEARSTPDMTFGLAYGHDRNDRGIIEAGLSFALPVFDRNQGRIREARHLAARARRDAEAVRGRLEAELAGALAAHAAARDRVDTFRERIVPASERALGQLRASYAAGRTDMLDLLDAQRSNARARLSLIRGLREAGAAEAQLWRLVGLGTRSAQAAGAFTPPTATSPQATSSGSKR